MNELTNIKNTEGSTQLSEQTATMQSAMEILNNSDLDNKEKASILIELVKMKFEADEKEKERQHQSAEKERERVFTAEERERERSFQAEEHQRERQHSTEEQEKQREYESEESKKARDHESHEKKFDRAYKTTEQEKEREHAEKQKKREQEFEKAERSKDRKSSFILKYFPWIVVLALVVGYFAYHYIPAMITPEVAVPLSSANFEGMNYEEVRKLLIEAGFRDDKIEGEPLDNLESKGFGGFLEGFRKRDGKVEAIIINGQMSFKKGTQFPSNATIRITYHSLKQ